jgi:hypothetical protein
MQRKQGNERGDDIAVDVGVDLALAPSNS